jgi:Holliday junction resolvase RusA-like endonuclease
MLHIVVPGEPQALARARAFRCGKGIRMYDSQKSVKWQMKQFMLHALTNYADGDSKESREHFHSGGYDVSIRLYCSAPSSLPKREKNLLSWGLLDKTTKSDIDNYAKLIFDAGNQTLWHDDSQIVSLYVKKYFCNDGKPRTEIWVMPKKQSKSEDVLAEVDMDEVVAFCEHVEDLGKMLENYRSAIKKDYDPDELYASSIAYHLTKIIDVHGAMLKKLDKHKKLWQNINAETHIPGEGRTLC